MNEPQAGGWMHISPNGQIDLASFPIHPGYLREGWMQKPVYLEKPHTFPLGTRVTKLRGSSWTGRVVGHYSSSLTAEGVVVESEREPGSCQLYPNSAMRAMGDDE